MAPLMPAPHSRFMGYGRHSDTIPFI